MSVSLKASSKSFILLTSLTAILTTQGCNSSTSTPDTHYKSALQSFEANDYKSSEIEIKNALQKNINYNEARILLGQIHLIKGDGRAASIELKKALNSDGKASVIMPLLGEALLLEGSTEEIITKFQPQNDDTDELRVQKLIFLAEAHLQLRDPTNAAIYFDDVLSKKPNSSRALLGLAKIARANKEIERATTLTDQAILADDDNIRAWLAKGEILSQQRKMADSIEAFSQAANRINSKEHYLYFITSRDMAFQYLISGEVAQAKEVITKLSNSPYKHLVSKDIKLIFTQAFIALNEKDTKKAKELGEQVVNYSAQYPGILLLLGTVNAQEKNYEQAERQLKEFTTKFPNHIQARRLLGLVQVSKNDPKTALNTLKPVLDAEKPDLPSLALMANAALMTGNPAQSSSYFHQALEQKPDESSLVFGLARSLIAQQDYNSAIEELKKIPESSDQILTARLAIIQTYIQAKKYNDALASIESLPTEQQNSALVTSIKGTVLLISGKTDEANIYFEKALEIQPGYFPALRQMAIMAIREGDKEKTAAIFEAALKTNKNNPDLQIDYAEYLITQGNLTEAESYLREAQELSTNKTRSNLTLANLLMRQGKPSLAISQLSTLEPTKNPSVFVSLGNARMMLGDYQSALNAYNNVVELQPNSPISYYLQHTALKALKNNENAKQSLLTSLKLNHEYLPALLAITEMEILEKNSSKAKQHLDTVNNLIPNNSNTILLKAEIEMLDENYAAAIPLYEKIFDLKPDNIILQKILNAYWKKDDSAGGINFLETVLKKQPNNAPLYSLLGGLHLNSKNNEAAIKAYKKSIELNNNNPITLNNLAWLLKDTNTTQAKRYAEQALQLAPESIDIKDTLETIKLLESSEPK